MNTYKGLHKGTENYWNSFQNVNLECQSPLSVVLIFFCKIIFDFFLAEGHDIMFVTSTRIYRKYNIAMYFLRRIIFHFPSKEKISFFRGTKPSFQIIQEISYSRQIFLKRPSFQNIIKISYFHVFFSRKIIFHFLSKE